MVITGSEQNQHHLKAFAKVNLFLAVGNKRDDGFHNILSLLQTISLYDELVIAENDLRECRLESNLNLKWNEENTLFRVVKAVENITGLNIGLDIFLNTRIPPAAGLGGASADAAAMIRFLKSRYSLSDETASSIAAEVGSDVPFLLRGGTGIAASRGELVEYPGDISGYCVKLALPDIRISTPTAYALIDKLGRQEDLHQEDAVLLHKALTEEDRNGISDVSRNSFEEPIRRAFPEVNRVFENLWADNSAILTRLSGSGSCVFNLYHRNKGKCFAFVTSDEVEKSDGP